MSLIFSGVSIPQSVGKVNYNANSNIKSVYFNGVKVWGAIESFPTDERKSTLSLQAGLTSKTQIGGNPVYITPIDFGSASDQWIWREQVYYGWSGISDPDEKEISQIGFKIKGNVITSIGGSGQITYDIANDSFSGEISIPFYRSCQYFSQVMGTEKYTGLYSTQANYGTSYGFKIVGSGNVLRVNRGDITSSSYISFQEGKFSGEVNFQTIVYNTNTSNSKRLYVLITFTLQANSDGGLRFRIRREFNTSTITEGTPNVWTNEATWSSNYIMMG